MDAYRTNCRCGRVTPGITNRREFLCRVGAGFGMLALADLLGRDSLLADEKSADSPMAPKPPHFAAQGAFGDLAFHGRWAVGNGHV